MSEKFTLFYRGTFSQWHPSKFMINDFAYNCAEQYMMAEKARLFGDTNTLQKILVARHPADQKKLGRRVVGFDEDRWNAVAREIVYRGNEAKFTQNEGMWLALLATQGTTLVEASPTDRIWGIGLADHDPRALDRAQWQGTNWLGEVLTQLREALSNKTH